MRRDLGGRIGLLAAACVLTLTTAMSATSGAPTPSLAPHRGGVFRFLEEATHSLDPAEGDSVYDALPVGQIFEGLVALDPGLNVVPSLAETWTISRDGRDYIFDLRDGVRFHDGAPLTAADVVFTLKRVLDPAVAKRSIAASYLQVVEGAPAFSAGKSAELPGLVAIDASRVEIKLARPYLSFLSVLAMDGLRIVPEHVVKAKGERAFRRSPVGTGPFRFGSWTDSELRLEAYAGYHGGAPYLDQIVIMFPRADERDNGNGRFLRGETDLVLPTSDTLPLLLADPAIEVHRYQDLSLRFMGMNTAIPPLDDVRIRRAIASAIDRKALAALSPATRREAQGILPPGLSCYSPTPKTIPYDPDAARALLAEAGHPGGRGLRPIPFYTAQSTSSEVANSLERMRADLAAVGISLEIHRVDWAELNAKIDGLSAPLFQLGWAADLPDPDAFLRTLFEPGGSANFFNFQDEATGRSLALGASETNPIERVRIYRELEKSVLEKAPLVPLFHSSGMMVSRRTVHGLHLGPMGIGALDFKGVWIEPNGPGL